MKCQILYLGKSKLILHNVLCTTVVIQALHWLKFYEQRVVWDKKTINRQEHEILVLIAYAQKLSLNIHADIWTSTQENISSEVFKQHRRRPACASAQSDQPLFYSLFGKYYI